MKDEEVALIASRGNERSQALKTACLRFVDVPCDIGYALARSLAALHLPGKAELHGVRLLRTFGGHLVQRFGYDNFGPSCASVMAARPTLY